MKRRRPHVLGVDDGPFERGSGRSVRIVGVLTKGKDLVEAVVSTRFPQDGDAAAEFLADWIAGLRLAPALQALVLGGITIAGLGVVDARLLSERLGVPVLVANRRDPSDHRLSSALRAAGLETRLGLVERTPVAVQVAPGLWIASAGTDSDSAAQLALDLLHESQLPEPLRLAHLIARGVEAGESRGRP